MQSIRNVQVVLVIALGLSPAGWGQGGRGRGAQTQQTAPPQNAAGTPAGRGGRNAGGSAIDFYNYDSTAGSAMAIPDEPPVETHQKITVGGQALAYTTRAGYMPLRNATTGQTEAHLFYTSYAKDGVTDAAGRPILFFVGGAPGVATSWQEFGGFGPKRMRPAEGGEGANLGSYENSGTLLAHADLIFVNPIGTAFSRPGQPGSATEFWNTAADTAALGEFVRSFLLRYNRRGSPLFVAGEDAATGRAAGLASYLYDHQIPVQGVMLLSMTMSPDALAGDAQYITLLPSLILSAWHHKKLSPELSAMSSEQIAGQARQFASREYLHALYNGDRMTAEERTRVIANLSRLTGLSKAFLVNNNLRVTLDRFNGELMRDQHRGISYSDARVTGFLPPPGGGRGGRGGFGAPAPPVDFNLAGLAGNFLNAYDGYLRHELNYAGNRDAIYYLAGGGMGAFTSTGSDDASLAETFARNPSLHLFVGVNYYDLNSPFYATEFTLAHLNVAPEVRAHNITVSHYEAGQMPYADTKALVKLQRDLAGFLSEAARK
jgi:carboxypeptidase C (cathepsin A)